jgi:DNA-binding MarR family transcriptional regulator
MTTSRPSTRTTPPARKDTGVPSARAAGEALLRVAQRLERLLGGLAAEHGLTAFQARALRALHDTASQSALAGQLGCTASRVSIVTGELEARGLVRRVAAVSDRRMRVARPTEEGSRVVDAIGAGLNARSPLSTALSEDEVVALYGLLAEVEAAPED